MNGAAPSPGAPPGRSTLFAEVRRTVRGLLEESPGFAQAPPDLRRDVAHKLVGVGMMAADLLAADAPAADAPADPPPLAQAAAFEAVNNAGKTIQDLRKALDFPTYVTSLISGVFQAITTSNINQITALSDMLDNISASQEEFSSSNIRERDVVQWAVQKFPFIKSSDGVSLELGEVDDFNAKKPLIKSALSASESEMAKIDEGDLMGTLGPLVQRKIGRDRQQILATLVQMGLQRIVVDHGQLHASMDMRVDARSVAEQAAASKTSAYVDTGASASVGIGAWGASAHVNAGFSRVESDSQYSKEEMAARAGLRSSVDLAFRTEQVPLDRLADQKARVKIDASARVPASVSDGSLLSNERAIAPPSVDLKPPADTDSATATKAREDAAKREAAEKNKPAAKPDEKPKTDAKTETKPVTKPEAKPDAKKDAGPAPK
jgi:hypothetical protein